MTFELLQSAVAIPCLFAQTEFSDLLRDPRASQMLIMVTVFGGGILIGLTAVIGGFWYAHRKHELEISLKHAMLERGLSAEDIQTVIEASQSGVAAKRCVEAFTSKTKPDAARNTPNA